ncbi:hypothetical protein NFI95_05635 [Acetobacteraceae bacterium KSS8]|uniref:Membrane-anchored protein n=1 Tax=Endosaccharibacter trunci TaxID=2812733 RepID=A0ABT1W4X9_9PROT|nr:hypothetical protein [Acetobacteraceae bacterium KSS8]
MRLVAPIPVAGPRYWTALCLASLLGADLGDQVAHDLHLGHWQGVFPLALLLAATISLHRRSAVATGAFFWASVVLLRIVATNIADLLTHDLHWRQAGLIAVLFVAFASAGARATPLRTDRRFWTALFLAGTLGTVLGDDASHLAGLEVASATLALATALGFALTAGADRATGRLYWPLVLLIRTAGTSIADALADRSGLGLDGSSAILALLFFVSLALKRSGHAHATA